MKEYQETETMKCGLVVSPKLPNPFRKNLMWVELCLWLLTHFIFAGIIRPFNLKIHVTFLE